MRRLWWIAVFLLAGAVWASWLHLAPADSVPATAVDTATGDPKGAGARVEVHSHESIQRLLAAGRFDEVRGLLDGGGESQPVATLAPLDRLSLLAEALRGLRRFGDETVVLQELMVASPPEGEEAVAVRLARAIDDRAEALRRAGRWDELDLFYQEMMLFQPGRARLYLELGLLRIERQDHEGATDVLSRIQHDPELGTRSRRLLEELADGRRPAVTVLEIPLVSSGAQFVVMAEVDHRTEVRLLLDTGASVTVLRPEVLARLGYSLAEARVRRFATANGYVEAPVLAIRSMDVGGAEHQGMLIGALELPGGQAFDGLLGMDFFRHYEFRIDQEGRRLYLSKR